MSTPLSLSFTIFLILLNIWGTWRGLVVCGVAGPGAGGLGQDAVGGEGHLLCGGARGGVARLACHNHYKVGVLRITRAFWEYHPGVGEGTSVVADLV